MSVLVTGAIGFVGTHLSLALKKRGDDVVGIGNAPRDLQIGRSPTGYRLTSSSSVYGLNEKVPFSESDRTDQPVSLYAATKKAGEEITRRFNLGNTSPVTVLNLVERHLKLKAKKFVDMPGNGDVPYTHANISYMDIYHRTRHKKWYTLTYIYASRALFTHQPKIPSSIGRNVMACYDET
ncbi:UDP-glucuronate 4-epimerase 1 [Linum perenne]